MISAYLALVPFSGEEDLLYRSDGFTTHWTRRKKSRIATLLATADVSTWIDNRVVSAI